MELSRWARDIISIFLRSNFHSKNLNALFWTHTHTQRILRIQFTSLVGWAAINYLFWLTVNAIYRTDVRFICCHLRLSQANCRQLPVRIFGSMFERHLKSLRGVCLIVAVCVWNNTKCTACLLKSMKERMDQSCSILLYAIVYVI